LQKRAARLILNKTVRTPTPGLFKQLKWLSFSDRCKYHTSILIYKTLNNMAPSYMTDIISFSKNDNYSLRSVKHNDLVLKKKPKTQFFKDSFCYYSISIWNKIPCNIRNFSSIQLFKSQYRNYLFNNNWFLCWSYIDFFSFNFYSICEYMWVSVFLICLLMFILLYDFDFVCLYAQYEI